MQDTPIHVRAAADYGREELAALLGILIAFRRGSSSGERAAEANWDLTQYRPKPKEW